MNSPQTLSAAPGAQGTLSSVVDQPEPISAKKVAIVSGLGSAIEYYDFALYGLLAVYLGPLFFPQEDSLTALLVTLGIFASAFVVRPLGGLFFGWFGDKYGRSKTLIITVAGMGSASLLMGCLPTYANLGVMAPAALLLCRLAQGFFAGGEVSGAATYIAECSPPAKRGFYGAFNPTGIAMGMSLAPAVIWGINSWVGTEAMADWGWRIPFLLSAPLVLITLVARLYLEDSPHFRKAQKTNTLVKTPFKTLVSECAPNLSRAVMIAIAQNAMAYIGLLYLNIHLTRSVGYPASQVLALLAFAPFMAGLLMPMCGVLSDRWGRVNAMRLGYASYFVLFPIALYLMNSGVFEYACFAVLALFVPYALVQAAGYPMYAELFPTKVRYSGVALSINIGALAGGATAPALATWLAATTGNLMSVAFVAMFAASLALIALFSLRRKDMVTDFS